MRAAVLSVVQQQKLATCATLLKEVAMVYGFALHIDPEVGEAAEGVATEGDACSHHPLQFSSSLAGGACPKTSSLQSSLRPLFRSRLAAFSAEWSRQACAECCTAELRPDMFIMHSQPC